MQEIVTSKIILVNRDGNAKIVLDADNDGYASIEIVGSKERFLIQATPEGKVFLSIDRIPYVGILQIGSEGFIFHNPPSLGS